MSAARCRECGAPIEWMKTTRGRRMPLDVVVNQERKGNVVVIRGEGAEPR